MSIVGFESKIGNEKIFKTIGNLRGKTSIAIRETWFSLGRDLKHEAEREILRRPKSGRTYIIRTKGGRARRHVASAAGETHANLSGALRKSVSWKVHGAHRMDFGYGFSTTDMNRAPDYDAAVEFGSKNANKPRGMEARPSIENSINRIKNITNSHFERAMLREFKRAM